MVKYNLNNQPLVSVIVNCHNGETYLYETIKSILNQTYKNFEVIFWNNKSTDKSEYIYKNFKDRRLKYFSAKKFTSLYEARNLAIKMSKGRYIAFIDCDDLWDNNKLSLQIRKFKNKNIRLVYSNYYFLNQITGFKKIFCKEKLPTGIIYKELLKNYPISICTVILKKEVFKKNKFNKRYNIIGDFDLFARISKSNYFAVIQKPLSIYRIHNKSFSNRNFSLHIKELKFWLKKQTIFKKKDLFYIKEKIFYMEAIFYLLKKKKNSAIKKIFKISSYKTKIKLFLFLLIPNYFLGKLKENFS